MFGKVWPVAGIKHLYPALKLVQSRHWTHTVTLPLPAIEVSELAGFFVGKTMAVICPSIELGTASPSARRLDPWLYLGVSMDFGSNGGFPDSVGEG
jgi:hypothetical protein